MGAVQQRISLIASGGPVSVRMRGEYEGRGKKSMRSGP